MGWKIYFWILLVITVPAIIELGLPRVHEAIDLAVTFFLFVGYYGFAWKKNILNKQFWKNVFILGVLWNLYYHFMVPIPEEFLVDVPPEMTQNVMATLTLLIFLPAFIAVYLYAFKGEEN